MKTLTLLKRNRFLTILLAGLALFALGCSDDDDTITGPGMPELLMITMLIEMLGLDRVALVTDGRFSGATSGPCVGHVSPEAWDGGPIAAVRDGDIISIDIPERKIELKVTKTEIKKRLKNWKPVKKDVPRGYLRRYRESVSPASKGAVLL